jgi:hypothetical protein
VSAAVRSPYQPSAWADAAVVRVRVLGVDDRFGQTPAPRQTLADCIEVEADGDGRGLGRRGAVAAGFIDALGQRGLGGRERGEGELLGQCADRRLVRVGVTRLRSEVAVDLGRQPELGVARQQEWRRLAGQGRV